MSRIGKQPVPVPDGVEITIDGSRVTVKSKLGQLERSIHPSIRLVREGGDLLVQRQSDTMQDRALHGLTRALVANMVTGVAQGFSKVLLIEGTGYRAETQGDALVLNVGYSHPVRVEPKLGITFLADDRGKKVTVSGIDKEAVGQVAHNIRMVRPPEPYKGKGIRYDNEIVRRKAGKSGKAGA
ncbi:MAG: 50S ribosomal protein L6 [Anaerolineae bacterium]|jgi:large subunit ribosomal protein L6|nr:50S ribosomal protein L6 [Ardenticatenia bacterium]MBK8539478.1 50S ribosomal protein L6 [Ardenticatenia bacterium]HQZ71341.1 50S ribosomal protein L6 [Anaerolineae bacterium]HRA19630.1 50S ribosomal protein L6 [Anaerolineae bacterium]